MGDDQRTVFNEKGEQLEKLLEEGELSDTEKQHIKLALEVGYAAAFCARTADMRESYFGAQQYQDRYQKIIKKVE